MNFCHEKFKLSRRVKKYKKIKKESSFFLIFFLYLQRSEIVITSHSTLHFTLYTVFRWVLYMSFTLYWQLRYGRKKDRNFKIEWYIVIKRIDMCLRETDLSDVWKFFDWNEKVSLFYKTIYYLVWAISVRSTVYFSWLLILDVSFIDFIYFNYINKCRVNYVCK